MHMSTCLYKYIIVSFLSLSFLTLYNYSKLLRVIQTYRPIATKFSVVGFYEISVPLVVLVVLTAVQI